MGRDRVDRRRNIIRIAVCNKRQGKAQAQPDKKIVVIVVIAVPIPVVAAVPISMVAAVPISMVAAVPISMMTAVRVSARRQE